MKSNGQGQRTDDVPVGIKPLPDLFYSLSKIMKKQLIPLIKNIQRAVGVDPDGVFGPLSAEAVWLALQAAAGIDSEPEAAASLGSWMAGLDARTISNIETLDPAVRENFAQFARRAKGTAATLDCDYVMISGNRTWAEQDALFAQRPKVTNARGGQSNHNFGIAGDFGVFRGNAYLDNSDPALAAKVHRACSEHAAACGLEWGGSWTSFKDLPHYEYPTGLSMAQKRANYSKGGSVL